MRDVSMPKPDEFMPREIALTLLASPQHKTNTFRKRCLRATEKAIPMFRDAPKTDQQRFQASLKKANASQLHKWGKRALRLGNRLVDRRDDACYDGKIEAAKKVEIVDSLNLQIIDQNAICEAIQSELTSRSTRGIGYRKPIKRKI